MSDEKKLPDENEVTEEQLEDVAGGSTAAPTHQDISVTKQADKASPLLMDKVNEGGLADATLPDGQIAGEDEDD